LALVAICRRYKHQRVLSPANFIERLGAKCPAIGLREHRHCNSCRGRLANPHDPARSRSSHEGARDEVGIEEAAVHIMNTEEHS